MTSTKSVCTCVSRAFDGTVPSAMAVGERKGTGVGGAQHYTSLRFSMPR